MLGSLKKASNVEYQLRNSNDGVYAFIIEGEVTINGQKLGKRDGLGVWETDKLTVSATEDAEVLLMEVPMK